MNSQKDFDELANVEIRLANFLTQQIKNSTTYFGYPEVPKNNDLSILGVSSLAKLHLNNAGDPWVQGNAKMHTKEFEREVLEFTANLYGIQHNYWGYITSGGTEGNLFGTYMGRDFFVSKGKQPLFLYAKSSHYSIAKNAHLLHLTSFPIESQVSGEMDYDNLDTTIKQIQKEHTNFGLVINLNIGTTMTGAIDSLAQINSVLTKNNIDKKNVFIHADAALMGFIYPFLETKEDLFANGVSSIAISGHKFLGAIHPCGIVLAKKDIHQQAFNDSWIPYIGTNDTTISGSRNGFLALNLWYIIQKKQLKGFKEEGKQCLSNAIYLYQKLKDMNYPGTFLFPNQIIVCFKKPCQEIIHKYQLATQGDKAHVVVMQHISKQRIDTFCEELKKGMH